MPPTHPSELRAGQTYSWEEYGKVFGFKAGYFSSAGGMVPSTATNSLLLVTHPGGGKNFDYADYWDGDDLIYTGRGQVGDQQLTHQNRTVDENASTLYVLEAQAGKFFKFLGSVTNVETRAGRGPDRNGQMRRVYLFRLRFDDATAAHTARTPAPPAPPDGSGPDSSRPFSPDRTPTPPAEPSPSASPEETQAKREQASAGHHDLLVALHKHLTAFGCTDILEMPGAIDLWAVCLDGSRVIFEAKTLSGDNELSQTRSGLAQLYEYRTEYGAPEDILCLVTASDLSLRRQKLLDSLGIAVLIASGADLASGNDRGFALLKKLKS